jgi:hypothetical protein
MPMGSFPERREISRSSAALASHASHRTTVNRCVTSPFSLDVTCDRCAYDVAAVLAGALLQ